MKNTIKLSALILAMIIFSGCSLQQSKSVPNQPSPVSATQPNIKTTSLQAYQNKKFGFEFEYPSAWVPDEENSEKRVSFHVIDLKERNNDYQFTVAVFDNIDKTTEEFLMHAKSVDGITREKTTLLGFYTIKEVAIIDGAQGNQGSVSYTFIKDGNGYSLTYSYTNESNGIGDKIISSFKFTK
jgi:hypothetical protein